MATHSSVLAWEIPWTEEPGGLQSMGSQSQTQLNTHTTVTRLVPHPTEPYICRAPLPASKSVFSHHWQVHRASA